MSAYELGDYLLIRDGTLDPSCGDRDAHLAHWGSL